MKIARLLSISCRVTEKDDIPPVELIEMNRLLIMECLYRAAEYRPDFVCFPEIMLHQGAPMDRMRPQAEPIPGPAFDAIAVKAREIKSHIIYCAIERDGDRCYNTAALIGRDGSLIGRYRKNYPPAYEMTDFGIIPGDGVPVWDTDAGRVGCAICFDLKFPETGLALSRGRAQIVFFPTMFFGGGRLASWAMDYGFHVVRCHAGGGAIVDPHGMRIASEGPAVNAESVDGEIRLAFAEINADSKLYHLDNHRDKMRAIAAKYGAGVEIRFKMEEGTVALASNMPDMTVDEIEREYELTDLRAYLDGAAEERRKRLR